MVAMFDCRKLDNRTVSVLIIVYLKSGIKGKLISMEFNHSYLPWSSMEKSATNECRRLAAKTTQSFKLDNGRETSDSLTRH